MDPHPIQSHPWASSLIFRANSQVCDSRGPELDSTSGVHSQLLRFPPCKAPPPPAQSLFTYNSSIHFLTEPRNEVSI